MGEGDGEEILKGLLGVCGGGNCDEGWCDVDLKLIVVVNDSGLVRTNSRHCGGDWGI